MKSGVDSARGVYLTDLDNNDFVKVREVDFGDEGAKSLKVCVKGGTAAGQLRVEVSGTSGYVANVDVPADLKDWTELTADLRKTITGKHDVTFRFIAKKSSGLKDLMLFDYWQFNSNSTGIRTVSQDSAIAKDRYFSLDGRETAQPSKGVNIMLKADGQVKKVLVR